MRKLYLIVMVLTAVTLHTQATELWSGSCTMGKWIGSNVTVEKDAFSSAATGNIIKVTFSAYAEKDDSNADVTYWQYNLGQKDNGWAGLTSFSGGDLTKGQISASYVLTSTNVTELQTYGLAVNGRYITVTKVELISATSESVWTGSTATGEWSSNVVLTYNDKGKLSDAQMNDYLQMTYTVTASGAQAAIQNAGWTNLVGKDDNSYAAEGDNTGKTIIFAIDDAATLEGIQQNGVLLRGKYITVTSHELLKASNRYDAVPLTIGTDGVATFGSSKNLDFSGISGVTPYYASNVEQGKVTLTVVTTTRGWAGYIVKGTAGTYNIPVTATEPTWNDAFSNLRYAGDYNDNKVYRSQYSGYSGDADESEQTKIKTYYRYIFAKDGSEEPGFYKLATDYSRTENETTVYYHKLAAHKAYLETATDVTPTATARVALAFGDETTAISDVQEHRTDGVWYTLGGLRVQQPMKGLYIKNGKKVIVK